MSTLVVMQPHYLPWPGYFNLIARSNYFVYLDDVQFSKQSWQQRNRVLIGDEPHWLTVPIMKAECGPQLICEVLTSPGRQWKRKHLATIQQAYGRHPYGGMVLDAVTDVLESDGQFLCDINIAIIEKLRLKIGIGNTVYRSSQLKTSAPRNGRTSRLVAFCRYFNADRYLSPLGAKEYIEADGDFVGSGIQVEYQNFQSDPYPQFKRSGEFVSNLSMIDALANLGCVGAASYCRQEALV